MKELTVPQLNRKIYFLYFGGDADLRPTERSVDYCHSVEFGFGLLSGEGLAWQAQCYRNSDGSLKEHRVDIMDPKQDGTNVFVIHQSLTMAIALAYYLFKTGRRVQIV